MDHSGLDSKVRKEVVLAMNLPSYPKIYNLGHRAIEDLFQDPVTIQEKVDGSQFSFGIVCQTEPALDKVLRVRSRGAEINIDDPPKLFKRAVEHVKKIRERLAPGKIYRGEVVDTRKHNCLTYDRVPTGNIVLFDVQEMGERYCEFDELALHAQWLEVDCVPLIGTDLRITDLEGLRQFLELESYLGGTKVEGIVIKNYYRFGVDGHVLMGKLVRPEFKEAQVKDWRKQNPTQGDITEKIIGSLRTEARWVKAIQHLKEEGLLEDSPKDIGLVLKEIKNDVWTEERQAVEAVLFNHFKPTIEKGIVRGFPEWYKERVAASQPFADPKDEGSKGGLD
jgi:hypothetical protein